MDSPIIQITIGKADPDRANGINVIVDGLAAAFTKKGLCNEVWGITPTPKAPVRERTYKLRLFQFQSSRMRLDPQLVAALEGLPQSAIVHLHGGLLIEFFLVARILKRRGIPWVLMPHGCYSVAALGRRSFRKRLYIALFDRFVIRHAKRIQLGSSSSANGLPALIHPPQAIAIPNGYLVPEDSQATLASAPFRFAFCGRFAAYHKGLDLLAEAFGLVARTEATVHLDLIGDGPDRASIEAILHSHAGGPLATLHGALFGEAKREALRAAHCFVLTSRHEGFPMALLEGAALGLPLLVTEGTNFAHYVRDWDCGMVVPELTREAIADTMIAMAATSPERLREMGDNASRLIRDELNWDRIANRVAEQLYRPILEAQV